MRRAGIIACLLPLAGCSGVAPPPPHATAPAQPARYLAGGDDIAADHAALGEWRRKHRDGIDQVEARAQAIQNGQPRPGCIGQSTMACAASIAATVPVADDYRFSSLFQEPQLDVNGRDLNGGSVKLTAASDIWPTPYRTQLTFDLRIGPAGTVTGATVSLPADPSGARTSAEYERTDLAIAIMAMTSATACPALTGQSVAQWFENAVKPHLKSSPPTFDSTVDSISESQQQTATARYCSRLFEFHSIQGINPDLVSVEFNPKGTFGGMVISVR